MFKTFLFALVTSTSGCSVGSETIREIRSTNEHTEKLVEATHKQILTTSLEQILAVDNVKNPVRMFPFAKTYSEEANEEEIVRTIYTLMRDAKESSLLSIKQRAVSLNAAASIAGLTPDPKTERIMADYAGDFYEPSVWDFLTLRYYFIKDALLEPVLKATHPCSNCKDKANGLLEKLTIVTDSSYVENLAIKIPALFLNKKVDPSEVESLKERIEQIP